MSGGVEIRDASREEGGEDGRRGQRRRSRRSRRSSRSSRSRKKRTELDPCVGLRGLAEQVVLTVLRHRSVLVPRHTLRAGRRQPSQSGSQYALWWRTAMTVS